MLALVFAACGPSLGDEAPLARVEQALVPTAKALPVTWQGQQTGYWCGPGSTRIALTARMASPPSQTTLANYLGTTTAGTNHIGLVANALNHYLGTNVYVTRNISDPPGPGQQQALRDTIVGTISNGYAMVGNVISGWRPPGYPGGTIYHYVAIVGYEQGGARVQIADPAGACAAGSGWCNVPRTYWVSIGDLAVWIGGKGYAGTNLPPRDDAPPTTGTLLGLIYQGGNTANRVAGAVVTVSGQSVTTGADGLYQFSLPGGSYTVAASKAGYGSAQVTRTVTAGAQTWGSMELSASAATGTLRGKIFALNPADPADMSAALAQATVRVGGQTLTTGADGLYAATLPPGTYVVQASRAGYADASLSRVVTAGATIWGSVGLATAAMPDTQPPQVAITFPQASATVDVANVRLTGIASDDRGALSEVKVALNAGAATVVPVTSGGFAVDVQLAPGENALEVTARDAAGLEGRARQTVRFLTGLSGTVRDEAAAPVPGATVTLVSEAGEELQRAPCDGEGRFAFDVSPQTVGLVVTAEGYRTGREQVAVDAERRQTVDVTLLEGADEEGATQGPGQPQSVSEEPAPDAPVTASGCTTVEGAWWLGWLGLGLLRRRRAPRPGV